MNQHTFTYDSPFELENGEQIQLELAYHTFGKLNPTKSNVVWVFHALSANSNVMDWWPGLFGEKDLFNPSEFFIVCVNTIGSPYGSTKPRNQDFPLFTVKDIAKSQILLIEHLGLNYIQYAIGGSFGGSQALEFALEYRGHIENLILIACAARESAWGIAVHEAQRLAMKADPTFGQESGGGSGIKAARAIGMLTYRTPNAFIAQQNDTDFRTNAFSAASYISYQGEKFEKRFDALCYYYLTKCMDSHHIGRNRGGIEYALRQIEANTLAIGIDSDQLLPPEFQKEIAQYIPNGTYIEISSEFGHDGFLIETKQISNTIQKHFDHNNMIKEVTVTELSNLKKSGKNYQLIDVREPFETEIASIGGENIPLASISTNLNKVDSSKQVIIYCRSGKRSATAIETIQRHLGLKNLYNLKGGILAWADEIDNSLTKY